MDQNSADGYLILALAQLQMNRLDDAEKSVQEACCGIPISLRRTWCSRMSTAAATNITRNCRAWMRI